MNDVLRTRVGASERFVGVPVLLLATARGADVADPSEGAALEPWEYSTVAKPFRLGDGDRLRMALRRPFMGDVFFFVVFVLEADAALPGGSGLVFFFGEGGGVPNRRPWPLPLPSSVSMVTSRHVSRVVLTSSASLLVAEAASSHPSSRLNVTRYGLSSPPPVMLYSSKGRRGGVVVVLVGWPSPVVTTPNARALDSCIRSRSAHHRWTSWYMPAQ
mmetsp:Transcript_19632/g.56507  ORF Transcript_19632/g.56507 Transcript_19632/m.56507 type:complete len:216 (+) Transcript_19632:222-869(+)